MVTVLLTGTPGTGKSSVAKEFSFLTEYRVIDLNNEVGEDYLYMDLDSKVVDPDVLSKKISKKVDEKTVIEGHLAHLLSIDGVVIVLRTDPEVLKGRLKEKGFSPEKIRENLEAEALDICLIESLERHLEVYELDTTGKKPEEIAGLILVILTGDFEGFRPGKISWLLDYFEKTLG